MAFSSKTCGAAVVCTHHLDPALIEDYSVCDICPDCGLVVGDRVIDEENRVASEGKTFSNEKADSDPSQVNATENPLLNGSDLSTVIGQGTGETNFEEAGVAKCQNRKTRIIKSNSLLNGKDLYTIIDRGTGEASFEESGVSKHQNRRTNPSLNGSDLSTVIERGTGEARFEESSVAKYQNRKTNPLLNESHLSTVIGQGTGDANFDESDVAKYQNIKMMSRSDRPFYNSFREISNMADRINLPKSTVDKANMLFKQVHCNKNLRGRRTGAVALSCVYIACRQEGIPRTFREISAASKVPTKQIRRCTKLILQTLEISIDFITAEDLVSRFCSNLELPMGVQKAATYVAKKAVELDIVPGRSPVSVAAAAVYMASQASKDPKSQKEIGDILGVAEATIRQSYKLMYPRAIELFPEDFKFYTPIENLPQLCNFQTLCTNISDKTEESSHKHTDLKFCYAHCCKKLLKEQLSN